MNSLVWTVWDNVSPALHFESHLYGDIVASGDLELYLLYVVCQPTIRRDDCSIFLVRPPTHCSSHSTEGRSQSSTSGWRLRRQYDWNRG